MKLYLIRNGDGKFKIGYTSRPIKYRLSEIQVGSSSQLTVEALYESKYAKMIEVVMHRMYSAYHVSGEWHDLPINIVVDFLDRARKVEENLKSIEEAKDSF